MVPIARVVSPRPAWFRYYISNGCIAVNVLLKMATPRFLDFTTCNFFENEKPLLWAPCCPRKECAHNTRFETRADTKMMGRRIPHTNIGTVPKNWVDIRLHYIRTAVSSSRMGGEEQEILHSSTSQLDVEPISIGWGRFTVKSAWVFCSLMSREALLNRVTYNWLLDTLHLDVLHAICRHQKFEILTLTSPAEEILANAACNPLFQNFIYLIWGNVSYSYSGKFHAIKLTA